MTFPVPPIAPEDVRKVLNRLVLADGFEIIFDHDRSHGAWFGDARTGREYLDFMTFFASSPIGYNHPKLADPGFREALARVARTKPSLSDVYTVEYARFVETFRQIVAPSYLPHGFFVEGGALAVENALKTAMDWKVRKNRARGLTGERGTEIVHLREAFHGRSGYTLSLTNTDPTKTDLFAKFRWPRIENPKLAFPVTPEVEARTEAAEERALGEVKRVFTERSEDIAAVIVEPIQGEGGDNHFRGEFLRALEGLCRENEAFFVVDEVQTGLGLTGKMWAHQHFGLQPDALAFGKKVQVCGCLVGPRVDEVKENVFALSSRLNSTWGGNLTDMVRSTRFLEVIHEERLVENARVVGERLLASLVALQEESGGWITNARGRGLMIAFDLRDTALRDRMQALAIENGLLVLRSGTQSIRFRPPLNLTVAEADQGIEIVRRSLARLRGEKP
jgi:L-lysine 6-transaminase